MFYHLYQIYFFLLVNEAQSIIAKPGWKEELSEYPTMICEILEGLVEDQKKREIPVEEEWVMDVLNDCDVEVMVPMQSIGINPLI